VEEIKINREGERGKFEGKKGFETGRKCPNKPTGKGVK